MKIAILIVTYNRLELLEKSITMHISQTRRADLILIVDNCSTDNTLDYLNTLERKYNNVKILRLEDNTGGAGGFYAGLKYLRDHCLEIDWVWLMDDDAIPKENALENILYGELAKENIYGSLPQMNEKCAWPNRNHENKDLNFVSDFNDVEEVKWIPFLGFLISTQLITDIGLPEKDFFLAADDVEYSLRARKHGSKIFIKSTSLIDHPCSENYKIFIGFRYLSNLKLAPWKRYYDTRNRLLVARKHYGFKFYWQTLPATFLRLVSTLIYEDQKFKQFKAFLAGIYDGITNKTGKRHEFWDL